MVKTVKESLELAAENINTKLNHLSVDQKLALYQAWATEQIANKIGAFAENYDKWQADHDKQMRIVTTALDN